MLIAFEKIRELEAVRAQIAALRTYEEHLARPILTDYNELQRVYDIFCELTSQSCAGRSWGAVSTRKKFIFIAAYIFAPGMLLGECIPKKLRMAIARTLKVKSLTAISNNWSDAYFYYKNYRDFRSEVEELTYRILRKLGFKVSA